MYIVAMLGYGNVRNIYFNSIMSKDVDKAHYMKHLYSYMTKKSATY